MMRPNTALLAIPLLAGALGCATADAPAQDRKEHAWSIDERPRKPGGRGPARGDVAPEMRLDNELGVLDTEAVEDALQARFEEVRACYERAGKAQEYAGGRVLLRFMVGGDGRPQDVLVVESSLGNYSVERCLVEVGRGVAFGAPAGHKATTFEYPVEFRSTNQMAVQDIDGLKIDHDLATFMPQLAACGQLAKSSVAALMYIEPSGFPGSVGLASASPMDETAGDCVVQTIRTWKMSATLPGRVLRANFQIPTVVASAEPAAPAGGRRAVSSASGRKRRR